jgi:hypothetical protein
MRLTPLLFALAMGLQVTAGRQAPDASVLSGPVRAHVSDDRFEVVTSVRGLPLGVRDGLQKLFGSAWLDIAEPGAPFRATDVVVDARLPTRRLVTAGCSIDHCLIYYERGGIAHTWHVALFHWTPAATRFEWGGLAPGGLRTIGELRTAALSGAVKASDSW